MTATLPETEVVAATPDGAVPCASLSAPKHLATVLVEWTDENGHGRDVPLCDPHATVLLTAGDSPPKAIRCAECLAPVVLGAVRPITP